MKNLTINVGDYVRINSGDIGIIINCPEQLKKDYSNWLWFETIYEQRPIRNEDIIKSSPRIIDLIQVGDYVNGHKVIEVDLDDIDDYGNDFRYIKTEHDFTLNHWVKENEIESILTKEQFESMEYKIER